MPSIIWGSKLEQASVSTRQFRRCRIAWLIFRGVFTSLFIFPFSSNDQRLALKQRWSAVLLDAMGIDVQSDLAHVVPGAMLVANHVSWVDVFVINALLPSAFVAKAEVRRWPIFGWLAMKNETIFMRRGSRAETRMTNAQIAQALEQGRHVAVFPEGTTSDGQSVLPFHGALVQPALSAKRPVVPIAISYWELDGQRSLAPRYDGDISFGQCLNAIISRKRVMAKLIAAPALGTNGEDRRQVVFAAREAIACAAELYFAEPVSFQKAIASSQGDELKAA